MKKVLLFIFVFSLFIVNVNATKLVSLGDSIPYGYLLDDREDSYDDRLAYTLKLDYYEYSYPGMRSDELLENLKLDEVKENIKDADIVIIIANIVPAISLILLNSRCIEAFSPIRT